MQGRWNNAPLELLTQAICVEHTFQVSLSFIVYPRPVGWKTVAGGFLVFGALYAFNVLQKRSYDKSVKLAVDGGAEEEVALKGGAKGGGKTALLPA